MPTNASIANEVDGAVRRWRTTVVNILTTALAVLGLPLTITVVKEQYLALTWPAIWVTLVVYSTVLVTAFARGWTIRRRMVILLTALYLLATLQLALTGLAGDGRIGLLMLPLLALILLGQRGGWIAAGISAIITFTFTAFAGAHMLNNWRILRENSVEPRFWLLQSLLLLAGLFPLMILLTRFQSLQMKTMTAERQARRELEEQTAARRRLEDEVIRVDEEERHRLGVDLHDRLCQHLTAALLHGTAVENQLSALGSPSAEPVRRIRSMIEESIGIAYDVAKGLCPVTVEPGSLIAALEGLARRTHESSGIVCNCRSAGPPAPRLARDAEHLYRIAQEAVTNAVKHARCSRIDIDLEGSSDTLVLQVRDDGIGRPGRDEPAIGGLGTRIMTYRACAMGGALTVGHPPEGGTIVTCRVQQRPDEETRS